MSFYVAFHPQVIGQSIGRAVHYGIILCENRVTCLNKDMRYLLALAFVPSLLSQTVELKDGSGVVVATLNNVKTLYHSVSLNEDIPGFQATVTNVSGEHLESVPVIATVRRKDGSVAEFTFEFEGSVIQPTSTVTHGFTRPWPYTPENCESVSFSLAEWWRSPEGKRRDDALLAKFEAERAAGIAKLEAEEAAKLRAACAAIHRKTANKKVSDLTVKEEQQVRACQALRLYPPSAR